MKSKEEITSVLYTLMSSCDDGMFEGWDWYDADNWKAMINHIEEVIEYIRSTKKKTREEMVEDMVEEDIQDIKTWILNGDFEFLSEVLRGDGWKPYNQLTDEEIEIEYNNRVKDKEM